MDERAVGGYFSGKDDVENRGGAGGFGGSNGAENSGGAGGFGSSGGGASALLSSLLSDTETLSRLTSVLGMLGNLGIGSSSPQGGENAAEIGVEQSQNAENTVEDDASSPTLKIEDGLGISQKLPDILSLLSSQKPRESAVDDRRIALLLAIKPYLSPRRGELIDSFIQLNRLGGILRSLS